jgi:hypothetical protein
MSQGRKPCASVERHGFGGVKWAKEPRASWAMVDFNETGGVTKYAAYEKGINNDVTGNSTYTVFVMDPKTSMADGHISSPGELSAHELLGHGLAMSLGYSLHEIEAVQATNLFLRSTGNTSYKRMDHGIGEQDFNGINTSAIPYYLNPSIIDLIEPWK